MSLLSNIIYEIMCETLDKIQETVIPAEEMETVTLPDLAERVKSMQTELTLTRAALTALQELQELLSLNTDGWSQLDFEEYDTRKQKYKELLVKLEEVTK